MIADMARWLGQVAQPPFVLGQRRAVSAGGDVGALDAHRAQQVADRVGGEGLAALGRAEALGVELVGDLREGQPGICQFAGPLGELGVVAELGQAGHRAADLRGRAVPARPYHLDVHLLAGAEHRDADLLDQMPDQLLAVGVGGGGRMPDGGDVGGQGADLARARRG